MAVSCRAAAALSSETSTSAAFFFSPYACLRALRAPIAAASIRWLLESAEIVFFFSRLLTCMLFLGGAREGGVFWHRHKHCTCSARTYIHATLLCTWVQCVKNLAASLLLD